MHVGPSSWTMKKKMAICILLYMEMLQRDWSLRSASPIHESNKVIAHNPGVCPIFHLWNHFWKIC
jgi:hypothetical protein